MPEKRNATQRAALHLRLPLHEAEHVFQAEYVLCERPASKPLNMQIPIFAYTQSDFIISVLEVFYAYN